MTLGLYKILPYSTLPKAGADDVGLKAWGLIRMLAAGLPVPAAFVLPTAWCRQFKAEAKDDDFRRTLASGIAALEEATGLGFGSPRRPLLVSVRSGAAASMPGMMETVLNIGLNTKTVEGLIGSTGNPRLAWDCYRRLVQCYAEVVAGLPRGPFDEMVSLALTQAGVDAERELDYDILRRLTQDMLARFQEITGGSFPDDPHEQLNRATVAVFRSWDAPRAAAYRTANGIDPDAGTSATIQRMVFGNAGRSSGAGVAFTRDPATGAPGLYVDFELNAQGEDVVAGRLLTSGDRRLRRTLPSAWAQLERTGHALEGLFRDAQDFEFTIQSGMLYLLQSRSAKRTNWAALRIAVDQVHEGLLNPAEALTRIAQIDLDSVVRTRLMDPSAQPLVRAQVAGMGVASGAIALDSDTASRKANAGTRVILVRHETDTADVSGLMSAAGILTAAGGRTSHAAVVARQLGKVCLVACPDLQIDLKERSCRIGGKTMFEGEVLSLDGNDGGIYRGHVQIVTERPERELSTIARWRASHSTG
jgi:pyruvate,orthophosphate dikinase